MKSRKIIHLPSVVLAVVSPTRMRPTHFLGTWRGGGVSSDTCVKSPWAAFAELVLCLCSNKKLRAASYFQAVAAVVVVFALSS